MSALVRDISPIAILLRLNAKSFEPVVAIREKYPPSRPDLNRKQDPKRDTAPYLFIVSRLYNIKTPALQARISKLASLRKPFDLKIGLPRAQVMAKTFFENGDGKREPLYGCGFEVDASPFDELKNEIFDDLNQHVEELRAGEIKPFYPQESRRNPLMVSIRSGWQGYTRERASEIVEELQKQYPDGFGSVTAEGIALRGRPFRAGVAYDDESNGGDYLFSSV
ncbi:hypothetical protein VTL71DRAFT_733 [Oculimacula yallundae]|uniref:Uncharacterized protein n=1 Tax=Oculimacula yallundae TaxID=86028 RepID=A0ABR4D0W4_9HELO